LTNHHPIILEKKKNLLLENIEKDEHPVVIEIVIAVHLVGIDIIITRLHIVAIVNEMIIIIDDGMMIDMLVIIVDDIPRRHHREIDILIDVINIKV
jgi:hypothetical protein